MKTFCTIITSSYLPFARVLFKSLLQYNPDATLQVLVIDSDKIESTEKFNIYYPSDIASENLATEIIEKYKPTEPDFIRWALKPVFISFLLHRGNDKVIFLDPDLYFTHDSSFLWNELEEYSMLLSPHNTETNPLLDSENFMMSFQIGMYNAGFVGATRWGLPALNYWAACCLFNITRDTSTGLFVDQKYLDLVPLIFDKVKLLKQRGCNLGSWNINTCKRVKVGNQTFINKTEPVIFIHFNHETIKQIVKGNDPVLLPHLLEYEKLLADEDVLLENYISGITTLRKTNFLIHLKRKTKIRTRLKNLLFRLSKKL